MEIFVDLLIRADPWKTTLQRKSQILHRVPSKLENTQDACNFGCISSEQGIKIIIFSSYFNSLRA